MQLIDPGNRSLAAYGRWELSLIAPEERGKFLSSLSHYPAQKAVEINTKCDQIRSQLVKMAKAGVPWAQELCLRYKIKIWACA